MRALLVLLVTLLLAGCLGSQAGSSVEPRQLDVFGIVFASSTDYREINGSRGTDEPCLRGFERTFDALDIVIGYGRDGRIRKLATRNPENSMFGVQPGAAVEEARDKIRTAGFTPAAVANRFCKGGLVLTLLIDRTDRVTGMILEATEL